MEALSTDAGEGYIQFIRELSIKCKKNDLVLSIDNYVPSSYTAFYNRKEQSCFADYIIIMGYDEHYKGSEEAGSVASIDFVKNGIKDTLKKYRQSRRSLHFRSIPDSGQRQQVKIKR